MVPKPFPFALGVGTDICRIKRIVTLLRKVEARNKWFQKVFTRLEWPVLIRRLEQVNTVDTARRGSSDTTWKSSSNLRSKNMSSPDSYSVSTPATKTGASTVDDDDERRNPWTIPPLLLDGQDIEHCDPDRYLDIATGDDGSPLWKLMLHLAGRWAAKEAVIKAHSFRRLYMNEISIITPSQQPSIFLAEEACRTSPVALIDPPSHSIIMDSRIAAIRGLRGCSDGARDVVNCAEQGDVSTTQPLVSIPSSTTSMHEYGAKKKMYQRRSKIFESDRTIARLSISHDGAYATATCIAADVPPVYPEHAAIDPMAEQSKGEKIIDNGKGPALHEPQFGDLGWSDEDIVLGVSDTVTVKAAQRERVRQDLRSTWEEEVPFLGPHLI